MTDIKVKLDNAAPAGLRAANNILKLWSCSRTERSIILDVPEHDLDDNRREPLDLHLTDDQILRISYVLNIYEAINLTFNNPYNIINFMGMANKNAFFAGKTPLSLLLDGNLSSLARVYQHIDGIRFK